MSLYDLFGLPPQCTKAQLKAEYKRLAQRYHPDKKSGDEEKFREIKEAYDVLSDDERRARYDETGSVDEGSGALDLLLNEIFNAMRMGQFQPYDYIKTAELSILQSIQTINVEIEKIESAVSNVKTLRDYMVGDEIIEFLKGAEAEFLDGLKLRQTAIEKYETALTLIDKKGYRFKGPDGLIKPWTTNENSSVLTYDS